MRVSKRRRGGRPKAAKALPERERPGPSGPGASSSQDKSPERSVLASAAYPLPCRSPGEASHPVPLAGARRSPIAGKVRLVASRRQTRRPPLRMHCLGWAGISERHGCGETSPRPIWPGAWMCPGPSRSVVADVERRKATTGVAPYLGALWALGLLDQMHGVADPDGDDEGDERLRMKRNSESANAAPGNATGAAFGFQSLEAHSAAAPVERTADDTGRPYNRKLARKVNSALASSAVDIKFHNSRKRTEAQSAVIAGDAWNRTLGTETGSEGRNAP